MHLSNHIRWAAYLYLIVFDCREAEESEGVEGGVEESSRVVEELSASLANTRLALGRKTRAVASLQRQLDQVPSRAELAQYQRRFVELYSQGGYTRTICPTKSVNNTGSNM